MKGLFIDAGTELGDVYDKVVLADDPPVTINREEQISADQLQGLLAGYDFVLNDHTQMPTSAMRHCAGL